MNILDIEDLYIHCNKFLAGSSKVILMKVCLVLICTKVSYGLEATLLLLVKKARLQCEANPKVGIVVDRKSVWGSEGAPGFEACSARHQP